MKFVEIDASGWGSVQDFVAAIKKAIGAPEGHGNSIDAFLDTMIYHDEINSLKSPYTLKIRGLAKADSQAREKCRLLAEYLTKEAVSDRGTDLEVAIVLEDQPNMSWPTGVWATQVKLHEWRVLHPDGPDSRP
jgi:hypothetical protein